jgi:hypothetical protein
MSTHAWDPTWIPRLLGATMIIQRTKIDETGAETHEEFWGLVMNVNTAEGVTLHLRGKYSGQSWPLPAGPEVLKPAPSGPFTLHGSGDMLERADYIARVIQKAA